jgi:thioredoxin-related protein
MFLPRPEKMKKISLTAFLLLMLLHAYAQQVKNFSLKNVTNGQDVSLETYPSCEGLLIIFSSNSCPYDEHYRDRIKRLSSEIGEKIPLLLVNSNTEPAESIDNMVKKAKELGLKVPYLADKEQELMKQLGATKNPHAFLLKNSNGKFVVVYSGSIDDNAQVEADVKHAYLKDAIDIMLANQTITTPEVRPTGCTIRRKS